MTCCALELCAGHKETFKTDLQHIAGVDGCTPLMDDLNITITKTDNMRPQHGQVRNGGDEQPFIFNIGASEAAHELGVAVHRVARWMIEHYTHLMLPCDTSITGLARWLLLLPNLREEHPKALTMVEMIHTAVDTAHMAIDRPEDRTYLGPCRREFEGDTCDASLYAVEGQQQVRCRVCRTWWNTGELREYLLAIAADQLVTASDAVGIIKPGTGIELTPSAIRGLKARGKLASRGRVKGRDLFRVGDIVAILEERTNG